MGSRTSSKDVCIDCSHLGIIMGKDTLAVLNLKKRCWATVDAEGYDAAARRLEQSHCQQASLPASASSDAGKLARKLLISSDRTQVKQVPEKPRPISKANPSAVRRTSDRSVAVQASQALRSATQTTGKTIKQQVDQPQLVAPSCHASAMASDSCSAPDIVPDIPSSHTRTPVSPNAAPICSVDAASTQSTLLPAGKQEQHKVEKSRSEDAKRERIAAYAANRQGAQLEAAKSHPSALLAMSPGTPPTEEAGNLNARQPVKTDTRMSMW